MFIKKPDLKAPRKRFDKGIKKYPNQSFTKEFLAEYPNTGLTCHADVLKIITTFNMMARDVALTERDGFEITGFGHLVILARESTRKAIDMKTSVEKGYRVNHTNFHTDGKRCIISLSIANKKFKNKHKKAWAFSASRSFRRQASAVFRKTYYKFFEIKGGSINYRRIIKTLI